MKCLKCPKDAISGKALCAECLAAHAAQVGAMETDSWVDDQLKATRDQARAKQKEASAELERQRLVKRLVACAVVLILVVLAVAVFLVWPKGDKQQVVVGASEKEGGGAQLVGAGGASGGGSQKGGAGLKPGTEEADASKKAGKRPSPLASPQAGANAAAADSEDRVSYDGIDEEAEGGSGPAESEVGGSDHGGTGGALPGASPAAVPSYDALTIPPDLLTGTPTANATPTSTPTATPTATPTVTPTIME